MVSESSNNIHKENHAAELSAAFNEEDDELPVKMKQHMDFIDIHKDGCLLLGASSLTSRLWTGDAWLFSKPSDAPRVENHTAVCSLESAVSCGKFIDGLGIRAVVCQDMGVVEVVGWEQQTDENGRGEEQQRRLVTHGRAMEHDGSVLAVDVMAAAGGPDGDADAVQAATCATDGCLKVWDLETLVAERTYFDAHSHWATGVSCHPTQPRQLASCGLDGAVLLWDTRTPRPSSRMVDTVEDRPQCVAWSPHDVTCVAVGWESGRVSLYNTLTLQQQYSQPAPPPALTRPLHALRWHHSRPWLACCGNDTSTVVLSADGGPLKLRYRDDKHTDMVRGLAWMPGCDQLFTCSWDGRVMSRTIV